MRTSPTRVISRFKNKTFKLPRALAERAEAKADRQHRSLNLVVAEALEAFVGGPDDLMAELDAINERAARRRGRPLEQARPFTRDELHER
jgi:predicted transcriptional regulator